MSSCVRALVATLLLAAGLACTSGPPPPVRAGSYEADVRAGRVAKDDAFRLPESPLRQETRASFTGLPYFDVNASYRVPASLTEERTVPPIVVRLPNSANELEQKVRVGTLGFVLNGAQHRLTAFAENVGATRRLWVPFRDETSGKETYGGGRYLDLERNATGAYDLDFNRAYHPYCVYNVDYVCPVPPAENTLPLPIRAGERLP